MPFLHPFPGQGLSPRCRWPCTVAWRFCWLSWELWGPSFVTLSAMAIAIVHRHLAVGEETAGLSLVHSNPELEVICDNSRQPSPQPRLSVVDLCISLSPLPKFSLLL